jgi:FtsH-binding integral membrane protein
MKEREANQKYRLELFLAMVAYMVVLIGSITVAKPMDTGIARTLLLISPAIPMGFAVWAIARHFRRMDEFIRLRSLEGLGVAAAVTACLSITYGFLESAGFPKLSMFWVWGLMGLVWGAVASLRCVFSR